MIQQMSHTHAKNMADLHRQGFEKSWSQQDFKSHIDNPLDTVLGYFSQGTLCGFVVLRCQYDQAEILTIIMGKKYQGKGLAKKLLQQVEQDAAKQGVDIVFLEVAKDNLAAIKLYQNTGYHPCGIRPHYYKRAKGRVDALLFQKKLIQL